MQARALIAGALGKARRNFGAHWDHEPGRSLAVIVLVLVVEIFLIEDEDEDDEEDDIRTKAKGALGKATKSAAWGDAAK